MCCLLFQCINDAAALITCVNCAIVCLRLSLPAPVCHPLPHAKRTMKSILFCEWHRWMIDRYPSLSVTHTARGLFPPSAHLSRNTGTHTRRRTRARTDQISWGITASLSLDTHRENNSFHCLYDQTSSPFAIDCSYLSYFNGDYCNHGCAREGRADSITWKWMQLSKCVCLGLYRGCS